MAIDLSRLEESPHLIDILIQMEDVLDSLDTYVFPGWMGGEVIAGPAVRRHWVGFTLKYDNLPDERAALRLIKHDVRVKISKGQEGEHTSATNSTENKEKTKEIWLVDIQIPRRLIADMNAGQLDFYDETGEIDAEDVQDANDEGMTDETGYVDNADPAADPTAQPDETGAPAAPQGANGPKQ